jgi:hypothetical protein
MAKMVPFGMSFEQALRAGYVGRLEWAAYREWIKTLPCATCSAPSPCDPSHLNGYKGQGTKSPDLFIIPQCRRCHEAYEHDGRPFATDEEFLARCIVYVAQAFFEGHLRWTN